MSLTLLPLLALLGGGPAAAQSLEPPPGESSVVDAAAEVIAARMGDQVSAEDLDAAAVRGMASWLDEVTGAPGNALLTREEAARRAAALRGERNGLGLEYTVAAGRGLAVTTVFAGSPAESAGVSAGDIVVAMDGQPFTGLPAGAIATLAQRVAGEARGASREVRLDLQRAAGDATRVALRPGPYRAAAARVTKDDEHVLVRVDLLGEGVADVIADALAEAGDRPVLVDLRDVGEGDLDAARAVAGLFVADRSALVVTDGPDGETVVRCTGSQPPWTGRVAVLVNRGTAGLAEALAHGLRAGSGAALVGTRTAGMPRIASLHDLGDGLVLQLADVELRAPDGASWAGEGLAPDLVVEAVAVPLVGPARRALPDIQRDAAVRFLSQR